MVYIYLMYRLGNNLFQIAAGASHAKKMAVPFKVLTCFSGRLSPSDDYRLKEYLEPFRKSILRKVDFSDTYPENVNVYNEISFSYNPPPLQEDLILNGFFQSEKYFDEVTVRNLFQIDPETEAYIQQRYGFILRLKPVAINVRRGDYLSLEYKHPVCRMSYFNKAIAHFEDGTPFLIISDDIVWCKKHFKGKNLYFIDDEPPLVDLYLQSMCAHNIISNSTFSWWGAWLNPNPGKKVIYPSPWFGVSVRKKKEYDTKDLCPDSWISVPFGKFDYYFYGIKSYCCRYLPKRFIKKIICK